MSLFATPLQQHKSSNNFYVASSSTSLAATAIEPRLFRVPAFVLEKDFFAGVYSRFRQAP
jgi:hypothetical protein